MLDLLDDEALELGISSAFEQGTAFDLSLYYKAENPEVRVELWQTLWPLESSYMSTVFMIACFELCYLGREDEF